MEKILFENDYFRVEHCLDSEIPGYCILFPKKTVDSFAELDELAQQDFAKTLGLIQRAINATVAPERIYTLVFAEILPTLHVHIFPRTKDMLAQYQARNAINPEVGVSGAYLFEWARAHYQAPEGFDLATLRCELVRGLNRPSAINDESLSYQAGSASVP